MKPTVDTVRAQIQRTLEQYFSLEEELQQLEAGRFRVCIFGSARIRPEHPTYQAVYRMSRLLAELGIDVVTGGGPGLMEAANLAVRDAVREAESEAHQDIQSIGLTIYLPRSDELANKHLDIKSEHRRFSSRLDEFMRLSHAVIVAPGGIGTMLELAYVWQLIQVGLAEKRAVVLLDRDMWCPLLEWMRDKMLDRALISPHDLDYVQVVDTPEEALALIKPELEKFRARAAAEPDGEVKVEEATRMLKALDKKKVEPKTT